MSAALPALIARYTDALRRAGVQSAFQDWSGFPPATAADLAALSAAVGGPLPDDLTAWLQAVDRQLPLVGSYSTQGIAQITAGIQGTRRIDFSAHLKNITGWNDGRFRDGRLAPVYWQPS